MKTFNYRPSVKIINWGCDFDSLLELKYAISIRGEYESLRSHIPIYYDPRTKMPTNYIRDNIRRYTPDFLIRHKVTKKAFLVEIKPRAFEHNEQLMLRKSVAENYIRWKNYDWAYKVVFDDEIRLAPREYAQFLKVCEMMDISDKKRLFQALNDQFDDSRRSLFTCAPSTRKIHFVMFGEEKHFRNPL